jgi:osmoprotectant transport system permease protein
VDERSREDQQVDERSREDQQLEQGGRAMNFLQQALSYIFTAANWGGSAGLMARTLEHLQYTAVAVAFSAVIAIPVGMVVGHTGRGTFLVVTGVNALRALPTLGVLLLGVLLWGLGLLPPTVALMLLGIPPLLAGTYAGIANVDPNVVDAARAMGMNQTRVLVRVELPNALPLILGGLRTATLQIVATATIAAYASLGGLGRYLIDGIKVRQFYIALVGALMVTALALILDALLALAVWSSVPGTGRLQRMPEPLIDDEASLSQMRRTSPTGDARGDPSLTVDG